MSKERYQKLTIDPQWLENQVDVPTYLESTNIYNQPPFARMMTAEGVFLHGIFQVGQEDKGKFLVVDLFVRHYEPKSGTFSQDTVDHLTLRDRLERIAPLLRTSYDIREQVTRALCTNLTNFLKPYPYSREYLIEHLVTEKDYGLDGRRIDPASKFFMRTYVAWADAQIQAQKDIVESKWIGLDEELPAGFSDKEDVLRAMPGGKSKTNKIYRLTHDSGALT